MNKKLLLKTAELIENASKPKARPKLGFNMGTTYSSLAHDQTGHNCDSVACIAGWILLAAGKSIRSIAAIPGVMEKASSLAELDGAQEQALFYGNVRKRELVLYAVKPKEAVAAIRRLVRTGVVL